MHLVAYERDSGGSTNQERLIHLPIRQIGGIQHHTHQVHGFFDGWRDLSLELVTADSGVEIQ